MKITPHLRIAALLFCLLPTACGELIPNDDMTLRLPIGFRISTDTTTIHRTTAAHLHLQSTNGTECLFAETIITEGIFPDNGTTRGIPVSREQFYDTFHVSAVRREKGMTTDPQFYMDEEVIRRENGHWTSNHTHYWPSPMQSLQFFAYAPADAPFSATPDDPTAPALDYSVPSAAEEQHDIMTAVSGELSATAAVPLSFRHICTAVRFVAGHGLSAGTLKSVALKGVHHCGKYDMTDGVWLLESDKHDFTHRLHRNTSATETEGTPLLPDEATFMMLPQRLPSQARLEVLFRDSLTGKERTLSAGIGGTEWPMGKTVSYRLSIPQEDTLEFLSHPEVQDAHYVIYPIHIRCNRLPEGWTMTSTSPHVTLRTELTELERQGFWIEEDKGTASVSSTQNGDDITVYAFLEENVSETPREAELLLHPNASSDLPTQRFTFTQLCPAWNGSLGCERIEEEECPWGFMWDQNTTLTYTLPDYGDIFSKWYASFIIDATHMADQDYVEIHRPLFSISSVTLHFDRLTATGVSTSRNDGAENTRQLYNYKGINDASVLMNGLEALGIKPDKPLPVNPAKFAARACILKNKFNKELKTDGHHSVELPVLRNENLKWYLPARREIYLVNDREYPLRGSYWTSTAANDNEHAYKLRATFFPTVEEEERTRFLHVRAVRRRP